MNSVLQTILFYSFLLGSYAGLAQVKDTIIKYRQRDIVDYWHSFKNKGKQDVKSQRDSTGNSRKMLVSVLPAVGYTLQTGFAGILSAGVAFYSSEEETQKLSSVFASFSYSQYKQFILPLQANVWTKSNRTNLVIDWRLMQYPSTTYGLGGNTTSKNAYRIDFNYLKLHQSLFTGVARNLYLGIGYYFDYFWGIKELNLPPNANTVFRHYGLASKEVASGPAYRILYDSRLNQVNPYQGFYGNFVYRPNFKFMGSSRNWQSLLLEFRKYFRLPGRTRKILAFWNYNWLTTGGRPPYLMLPSTGWDDPFNTGRGYIQGRFRAFNMLYLEAEFRFDILRNGFLGGVVFSNAQTFLREPYTPINKVIPGGGAGLRIKLNKYSGSNLCIDYGIGIEGSRGFFINLNEVF